LVCISTTQNIKVTRFLGLTRFFQCCSISGDINNTAQIDGLELSAILCQAVNAMTGKIMYSCLHTANNTLSSVATGSPKPYLTLTSSLPSLEKRQRPVVKLSQSSERSIFAPVSVI